MTFKTAIRTCFGKYATFKGRATRPEYWYFVLFILLGGIATSIIDGALFGAAAKNGGDGPVSTLFSLGTFIPLVAAGWRRMHDTGRSGLYLLYPILVWVGIASFMGMVGATGPLLAGDFATAFSGLVGVILGISVFIAVISPLIVIWWLTRPTQPGPNQYGPNPNEVSA